MSEGRARKMLAMVISSTLSTTFIFFADYTFISVLRLKILESDYLTSCNTRLPSCTEQWSSTSLHALQCIFLLYCTMMWCDRKTGSQNVLCIYSSMAIFVFCHQCTKLNWTTPLCSSVSLINWIMKLWSLSFRNLQCPKGNPFYSTLDLYDYILTFHMYFMNILAIWIYWYLICISWIYWQFEYIDISYVDIFNCAAEFHLTSWKPIGLCC